MISSGGVSWVREIGLDWGGGKERKGKKRGQTVYA